VERCPIPEAEKIILQALPITISADAGKKRLSAASPPPSEGPGYGIFFREWLANGSPMIQLPISAACNCRCLFCSNHLNPFPVARGLLREVEDIKLQLALMDEKYAQAIRLSDSLPGRIAEGEAFLHPRFFEILRLIRRKFPMNLLCFTTNGSMLDEAFARELSKFRPIEITVSMHSTRPDLWARIFGKNESAAATAVAAPGLIRKHRMNLVGTIVPLPAVCGWEDIENTYGAFVSAGARGMILFKPGYSRLSPPDAVRQMECSADAFMDFADRMRARYVVPVSAYPYTRGDLKIDYAKILAATAKGNPRNGLGAYRRVLWLASEAARGGVRLNLPQFDGHFEKGYIPT
jgi:Radical SAM superfamily